MGKLCTCPYEKYILFVRNRINLSWKKIRKVSTFTWENCELFHRKKNELFFGTNLRFPLRKIYILLGISMNLSMGESMYFFGKMLGILLRIIGTFTGEKNESMNLYLEKEPYFPWEKV